MDIDPFGFGLFSQGLYTRSMVQCSICKQFKPFSSWDLHQSCPRCRTCSPFRLCAVCKSWTKDRWAAIKDWIVKRVRVKQLKAKLREASKSVAVPDGESIWPNADQTTEMEPSTSRIPVPTGSGGAEVSGLVVKGGKIKKRTGARRARWVLS